MVKVYYANIRQLQETDMQAYLQQLNIQRREKVLRCKHIEDKKRSLMAGILLRYALEQEGVYYESLEFSQNSYGKTMLKNCENIYFSISHAGEYVICGIADVSIGVDIESVKRAVFHVQEDKLNRIAKKSCTPSEYAVYEKTFDKKSLFLNLWTRKEAYSKAVGRGLGIDFSQIEVLQTDRCDCFWSDWLREDYYVSVYLDAKCDRAPILIEWKE